MIYEFECPRGHVTEALVRMGTEVVVCQTCFELMKTTPPLINHDGEPVCNAWNPLATRILSATRTTFRHADRSATKRPRG